MAGYNREDIVFRLSQIFEPYWRKRRKAIQQKKGRFIHYTSAENAYKIISGAEFWLRSARCMNDYSEMSFGRSLLLEIVNNDDVKSKLEEAVGMNNLAKGFEFFDGLWSNLYNNTFIACISEHEDHEDLYGRLSMWRAYGEQSAKAALVFQIPFDEPVTGRGSGLSLRPVMYFDRDKLHVEIENVISNLKQEYKWISSLPDGVLPGKIAEWLLILSVCLKHPGFKEEKEWRTIYFAFAERPNPLPGVVEVIQGVPQVVYKLKIEAAPGKGLGWMQIPDLVDKIIIGPTQFPGPIFKAFADALYNAGVTNPGMRIVISDIPLRT